MHFSEPFAKEPPGPHLLEGHRRNVALAFARGVPFTHALLLAPNCAFVRDVVADSEESEGEEDKDGEPTTAPSGGTARSHANDAGHAGVGAARLREYARAHPAMFGAIASGWHWTRAVLTDACLAEWWRAADAAIGCEAGAPCALRSVPGLRVGGMSLVAGVSESLLATRRAWHLLLPLVGSYVRLSTLASPAIGRFEASVSARRPADVAGDFPAEEVVLATAVALLQARVAGLGGAEAGAGGAFAHVLRAYFEFGREVHFTPTSCVRRCSGEVARWP